MNDGRSPGSGHRDSLLRQPAIPVERLTRPRRGRRWFFLLFLACLAFMAAAALGLFRVRQVEVVGVGVPRDQVVQVAGVTDRNIFTVQSDRVIARLRSVPSIVVRRVDTIFPDRVRIYATARVAQVAWQSGTTIYEMDGHGVVVREVERTSLPTVVATDGAGAPSAAAGSGVVQAVQYALRALPSSPKGAVATFQFHRDSGLTIVGRAGWRADLGTGTSQTLVNRVATLAALLDAVRTRPQRLKYVDLRSRAPFARFTGT